MQLRLWSALSSAIVLSAALCAQDEGKPAFAVESVRTLSLQDKFDKPLFVAFHASHAGRAFVVEQTGKVWSVPHDDANKERSLFLDLSSRVLVDNWEEGLLGSLEGWDEG